MTPFYDRLAELERRRASFAVATVVGRRSPVSSHLGDRALVFADGHMEGFVGGSCSRDIVRRQALGAIRSGRPLLLQIRPDSSAENGDDGGSERVILPMSCASEGAVDVYIEPHLPLRSLAVIGFTPVAEALARMAAGLEYAVVRVVAEDELRDLESTAGVHAIAIDAFDAYLEALDPTARARLVAVVASQGHYDEEELTALLASGVAFVGLLASRKRAAGVFSVLGRRGISRERIATIRNPVGLDIGARTPGEVAVSIVAEIVQVTPTLLEAGHDAPERDHAARLELDPVCGMGLDPDLTRHRYEHGGRSFFFCCAGCADSFAAEPQRYLGFAAEA